jgi:hypothetical protein
MMCGIAVVVVAANLVVGKEPRLRIATDLLSLKEILRPAILDENNEPLCRFM